MKVCVLIPSYNESKTIGSLVEKIKAKGLDVVVIDDGSVDQTSQIARKSGAEVLRYEENKGKGASLKGGFCYVLRKDYEAVITMDADGQHSPENIPDFINAAAEPDADIVVGNRMSSSKGMPHIRWLTNHLMSFLISKVCAQDIPDSQCGFRLIKRKLLEELNLKSDNYEIESEILVKACCKGFKIKFIPIRTIYAKEASQINPVVDTIRFSRFIWPLLFKKIAPR